MCLGSIRRVIAEDRQAGLSASQRLSIYLNGIVDGAEESRNLLLSDAEERRERFVWVVRTFLERHRQHIKAAP